MLHLLEGLGTQRMLLKPAGEPTCLCSNQAALRLAQLGLTRMPKRQHLQLPLHLAEAWDKQGMQEHQPQVAVQLQLPLLNLSPTETGGVQPAFSRRKSALPNQPQHFLTPS